MKKIIMYGLIMILLIMATNASTEFLGTFKTDEPINIIQTCASCTYINITSITGPDSVLIVSNVNMTKDGFYYNYTLSGQDLVGTYNVCGIGDLDGEDTVWCYYFDVTFTGTQKENNILSIILLSVFIIILLSVLGYYVFNQDMGKVCFWLSFSCFGFAAIQLLFIVGIIYINEVGKNITNLLYINMFSFGFFFSLWSTIYILMVYMNIFNFPKNDKWDQKKW